MSIINCPECKNGVSDQAENCPHCGYKLPQKSGCAKYLLILVGILIIFSWLGKSPTSDKEYDQTHALNLCEQYIKPRLKNPSSADFDDANAKAHTVTTDSIIIYITVRATNTYNAIVPTNYACFVNKASGKWQVESIQETP